MAVVIVVVIIFVAYRAAAAAVVGGGVAAGSDVVTHHILVENSCPTSLIINSPTRVVNVLDLFYVMSLGRNILRNSAYFIVLPVVGYEKTDVIS